MRTNSPLPMFFRNGQPVEDVYTKLLLHFDGNDGDTTSTDSSGQAHSLTLAGNTEIDTAQSVFGGSSCYFPGSTGDYVETPYSTDFDLGTIWTIDFRMRYPTGASGYVKVLSTRGGAAGYEIAHTHGNWYVEFFGTNPGGVNWASGITSVVDTWYHVASVADGTNLKLYINGLQRMSVAYTADVSSGLSNLRIGGGAAGGEEFTGWIDELRIVKGEAKWTTNFTPPTSEY